MRGDPWTVGENGAGKSTLVRLIAGIEDADGGAVTFFDREMPARFSPEDVAQNRVVFIHQNLGLVEDLSVAENVALAAGYGKSGPFISWRDTRRRARAALEVMGVDLEPDMRTGDLPVAMRAVIAIARALAHDVRLLVLDEPTATLAAHEVEVLFGILRRFATTGVAIVLITHRLDEVRAIADRITVLRDGHVAGVHAAAAVDEKELVRLIVGADLPERQSRKVDRGAPILSLRSVRAARVGPLTFDVHGGEVLGVTGLSGSGHAVLPRLLFGYEPIAAGEILLDGQRFAPLGPAEANERGCALVPADRNGAGAVPTLTLRENLYLNPRQHWLQPIRRGRETRCGRALLRQFDVRPADPAAEFSTLSGGNAQKVVLARCLSGAPRLLVLEEPTAAVDIGARTAIHARMRDIAGTGQAVLVVSSDLEEIEQVCDRAIVMERGHVQGVLESSAVTASALLNAAYGVRLDV